MTSERWPNLPVIGSASLPVLGDGGRLWNALFDLSERLPAEHAIIGGVMVYLHGFAAGRHLPRVTEDVDVLFDIKVAADSPPQSTH